MPHQQRPIALGDPSLEVLSIGKGILAPLDLEPLDMPIGIDKATRAKPDLGSRIHALHRHSLRGRIGPLEGFDLGSIPHEVDNPLGEALALPSAPL